MKFTTKQEYIDYRKNWKAQYKELSQKLRDIKFIHRAINFGKERFTADVEAKLKNLLIKYNPTKTPISWNWEIARSKITATNMLAELKESKIEAQNQYLASKNEELVTA